MQNNVNTNISWYEWHNYQRLGQKIKILKILCTKYMASSEAMTSSTHSFAYSYGLVKKCFLKICETSKFHNFLIFQPIFIRFSLFCSENFTLSSEIKLDQLRTSPLMLANPYTYTNGMSETRNKIGLIKHLNWNNFMQKLIWNHIILITRRNYRCTYNTN